MMEEFLVDVSVEERISDVLHSYPDKLIHLYFYRVSVQKGILNPVEHQNICWADGDMLLSIGLAGGDLVFAREHLSQAEYPSA